MRSFFRRTFCPFATKGCGYFIWLAEAERQYNEANQAVNQAVDNETAVREAQEQLFATAEAENEALISQAEGQIAELRATLAAKKQDLASALAEIDRAAMNLATDQVNGQAKVQDKFYRH